MGMLDAVKKFLTLEPMQERSIDSFVDHPGLTEQLMAVQGLTPRPWRVAGLQEALGVPAIFRAASLIANTTGALSMEAFRKDGTKLDNNARPRVIVRPNPFTTPRDFYRDTAWAMATRGEAWWWVAKRGRRRHGPLAHPGQPGRGGGHRQRARPPFPDHRVEGPPDAARGHAPAHARPRAGRPARPRPAPALRSGDQRGRRGAGVGGQLLRGRRLPVRRPEVGGRPHRGRVGRPQGPMGRHAAQHAARHDAQLQHRGVRGQPAGRPDAPGPRLPDRRRRPACSASPARCSTTRPPDRR